MPTSFAALKPCIAAGKSAGGTSAGLAVQGEFLYAALNDPATRFGIVDERPEVVDHWRDAKSWMVPPVAVACDLLGGGTGLELLIGHTPLAESDGAAGSRTSTGDSEAYGVGGKGSTSSAVCPKPSVANGVRM